MSRSITVETIVLKSHDVGEADRFCILFTREKGKLAVRARGVRKLGSKLGGHLLPMRHAQLTLREGSAGYMVQDARRLREFSEKNITAFLQAQQGIELLLAILHDEEPLPELFDVTLHFLDACDAEKPHTVLPFTISLLQLSGLLPDADDAYFARCSDAQRQYIRQSCTQQWDTLPTLSPTERELFSVLCAQLLSHISSTPLKAGAVATSLRSTTDL